MTGELVERDVALATVADALADARAGKGRVVLVHGEAGIGKTALLQRVAADAGGRARVLWGACDPLLTPRALGPIHDAARQAPGPLADAVAAGASREAIFGALLDDLERRPPAVLVVEDAHWADEATLDALGFLGRRIERTTAAVIVSYRDDEVQMRPDVRGVLGRLPAGAVRRVELPRLSPAAVDELARRARRDARGLHAATGGNPFLVTELLSAPASDEVPASVREAVIGRLARLSDPAREIVDLVAVAPARLEIWVLDEAMGPLRTALQDCLDVGILTSADATVGFRHELAHAAVAAELSPVRQRELDRRLLVALGTRDGVDAARLAHHARRAGDLAAVARHAPAAAAAASAVGAHREALEHAEAAVEASPPDARAELLEQVSFEAYLCGRGDRALEARREALAIHEAAGNALAVGDNTRWLARLLWWSGRGAEAERASIRAVELLEPFGATRELGMAYSTVAQLRVLALRLDEAIEAGSRAIELARKLGDVETLVHALTNVGTARINRGELNAGRALLEEAFARGSDGGHHDHAARAVVNIAWDAVMRGRTDADAQLERALAFARGVELGGYVQYLLGMRAALHLRRGEWELAERDAEASLKWGESGASVLPALVTLGLLWTRRGDPRAWATLEEAHGIAVASDDLQPTTRIAAARVEHAWLAGERSHAVEEAVRVYERAAGAADPGMVGELAFRLWLVDALDEAPPRAAEPYRRAIGGDLRGAAVAWEASGRPYEAAEALSLAEDDDALLRALTIFDRLGAAPAAARVRRRLRERGVRAIPRGPRPATRALPAGLTPRQLEVVRLLAAGATNAEIARRLVIATKTVDHHVSAILAKLGVDSRREAVEVAHRLGIAAQDGEEPAPK